MKISKKHFTELAAHVNRYDYKRVEIAQVIVKPIDKDGSFARYDRTETLFSDFTYKPEHLLFDSAFTDEDGMHITLHNGEDNIFYCASCVKESEREETVIFRLYAR